MDHTELLRKALLKIRQLEQSRADHSLEPIAIVSTAMRLPGNVNDLESYWKLLSEGKEGLIDIPQERWDLDRWKRINPNKLSDLYVKQLNFLQENIRGFDTKLFGVSPAESVKIDPQHRLLMKLSWEALERANINPLSLGNTKTGVFIGIIGSEYVFGDTYDVDAYSVTGCNPHMASGRISHAFGLQGPSFSVDTACSSSLTALSLASNSLKRGECDLALVGGVMLMINENPVIGLCKMGAMSLDGRCKSFDIRADGYGRAEGGGVIVLKRLSDAERSGDTVLGVIKGSALSHDGRTSGITVPSKQSQIKVMRDALANANVTCSDIDYVEAHGTGTPIGDPIEIDAMNTLFSDRDEKKGPVLIGSSKANVGHLEAASGIASINKVLLCLQEKVAPQQVNLTKVNPHLKYDSKKCEIIKEEQSLVREKPLTMMTSGYGFSGSNACIVIEEYRQASKIEYSPLSSFQKPFIMLSANSGKSLLGLAKKYHEFLKNNPSLDVALICSNTLLFRARLKESLILLGKSVEDLLEGLNHYIKGEQNDRYELIENTRKIVALSEKEREIFFRRLDLAIPQDFQPDSVGIRLTKNSSQLDVENECPLYLLASFYAQGLDVNWRQLFGSVRKIQLPTYVFDEKDYWNTYVELGEDNQYERAFWLGRGIENPFGNILHQFLVVKEKERQLEDVHYVIHIGYIQSMINAIAESNSSEGSLVIENADFSKALYVDRPFYKIIGVGEKVKNKLQLSLQTKSNENWVNHFECLASMTKRAKESKEYDSSILEEDFSKVTHDAFYAMMIQRGIELGESVRCVKESYVSPGKDLQIVTLQSVAGDWLHPGIFDAMAQAFHLFLVDEPKTKMMVRRWKKACLLSKEAVGPFTCKVMQTSNTSKHIKGDVDLFDRDGRLVYAVNGLELQKLVVEHEEVAKSSVQLTEENKSEILANFILDELSGRMKIPIDELELTEHLYSLGFDSIMGIKIKSKLEQAHGIELGMGIFANDPTIGQLIESVVGSVRVGHPDTQNWFRADIKDETKPTLFCLPYGGGGASTYMGWKRQLSDVLNVVPIQLPGREELENEPCIDDLNELVKSLAKMIQSTGVTEYYLYGHSMGGYIAFSLCEHIAKEGKMELPQKLFIGGAASPAFEENPWSDQAESLAKLLEQGSDLSPQFIENADDYSEIPLESLPMKLLESDHNLVKQFYDHKHTPLDINLMLLSGNRDKIAPSDQMVSWKEWTTKECDHRIFEGTHFFLKASQSRDDVLNFIKESIRQEAHV